jgi:hypothetical protein
LEIAAHERSTQTYEMEIRNRNWKAEKRKPAVMLHVKGRPHNLPFGLKPNIAPATVDG